MTDRQAPTLDLPLPSSSFSGLDASLSRTAWHTHPVGQLLVVTEGRGWVQEDGQPRREIKAGDVVWIEAGVKHWHGASPTVGMSQIAIAESPDGKSVEWKEKVSKEQHGQ